MKTPSNIRIEVKKIEERPAPFHWELFREDEREPFLVARGSFRTARAALADAQATLDRHRKRKFRSDPP